MSGDTGTDQESISIDFNRGDTIGGRLSGRFDVQSGQTYFVDRDVIVLPEGELRLFPGATLEFENGIGMLVQVGAFSSRFYFKPYYRSFQWFLSRGS